ncbi:MAG: hypothetical protein D6694_06875 [Gammaproteobacteria bacterium]|nr:MAG: hypothetical protein D6694_06875 [Gammaproteobacteria bacterium]
MVNASVLLCLFFLQTATHCQAQPVFRFSFDEYSYFVGNQPIYICEIIIENTADSEYVFWLDTANISGYSNKDMINSYFRQRKGDFSFYDLMTENLLNNKPSILFGTFLKKMGKRERFVIRVIGHKSLINVCKYFIRDHFAAVKKEELFQYLKLTDVFFPWYDKQSIDIKVEFLP